jgi:oligoendopeptidase F
MGRAMKTKRIPNRSELRTGDTWDLARLFKSDEAWERAFKKLTKKVGGFRKFKGKLGRSARMLRACYDFETDFSKQAEKLGSYAFLKSSENVANDAHQGMRMRYIHLATQAQEESSYIAPEIRAIPKKKMDLFLKSSELKAYRFSLEKLLRYRDHILSGPEERVLAMQGEVADAAENIFEQLNDADLKFGFVKDERGQRVELTQSSLISLFQSPRRSVRREAFEKFYATYEAHQNTTAATLSSSVLHDVYHARVRNYPSALEAALFADKAPLSVYNSLIQAVHDNLDTVYKYFEIRRKALRLKDIHIYDCYVPLAQPKRVITPYEKAVAMVCEALAPLGASYCRTLEKGLLDGRWVDRYENEGKRSGAFSAGGYSGPPYILINYKDDVVDSVFTLAHEAGHSMHTYYSARSQPFQYYDYTIFVAEVASTFNEQLLSKYMLDRASDRRTRAFLISREIDEIRGTLIRQTMFAEFEKTIHEIVESHEPLTREHIRGAYRKLLELYFGPQFTLDGPLSIEGMRIPHFYRAFYVYKYATGMAAAIALAERVLQGSKKAREDYVGMLKAGGSKYPLDILREAGVDMEKPGPVATAMNRLKELVDELDDLL